MRQRVAQTLRHLAKLVNHQTAQTNAGEASDILRKRRQEQEHVDEYMQGLLLASPSDERDELDAGGAGN